ncbi:hypothetical protein ACHAXA_003834 [Cyclostephanos tholiformis]|uniref:Uncharacterized protein n=1 Tax=Cyclostephanos tholiformis TaxID=382380 RepID=A0ABD3R6X5_9STRA
MPPPLIQVVVPDITGEDRGGVHHPDAVSSDASPAVSDHVVIVPSSEAGGGDGDEGDDTTVLSLSSDTSATSLASDISDGVTTGRRGVGGSIVVPILVPPLPIAILDVAGRPRSASLVGPTRAPPSSLHRRVSPFPRPMMGDDVVVATAAAGDSSSSRRRTTSNTTRSTSSSSSSYRNAHRAAMGTSIIPPRRRRRTSSFGPLGAVDVDYDVVGDLAGMAAHAIEISIVGAGDGDGAGIDVVDGTDDDDDGIVRRDEAAVASSSVPGGGRRDGGGGAAVARPGEAQASDVVVVPRPPPPPERAPRDAPRRAGLRPLARVHPPPQPLTFPIHDDAYRRHVVVGGGGGRRFADGGSCKQRPSHRKLRRWDNDNFVGLHVRSMSDDIDDDHRDSGYWTEYQMPNYPRGYVSEFSRLIADSSVAGVEVRERFARGEVATTTTSTIVRGATMERAVSERYRELGIIIIPPPPSTDHDAVVGSGLYRALSPRLRSVLSRSCAVAAGDDHGSDGSRGTVAAFEGYLVSLALSGFGGMGHPSGRAGVEPNVDDNDNINSTNNGGYPPLQSREVYDMFGRVLARPPRIVVRSRTAMSRMERPSDRTLPASLVPAVHFHFATDDNYDGGGCGGGDGNGKGGNAGRTRRSSAFHRILLHSVCQFHGLVSSSSIVYTDKRGVGDNRKKNRRRGGGDMVAEKVVTVQAGVLLAPALKLLDHVH